MKKRLLSLTLALAGFLSTGYTQAQFSLADVEYWIGSGSDSSVLVVDFLDATWDSSYAWGYLHNGTATGEDMLNAVSAADTNFSANIIGGFLNDITYGKHAGVNGTNSFFWGTWSGTGVASFSANAGVSEVLANGDFFGCSFTDFSPAVSPGEPIPAFQPLRFTAQDVEFWVGSGTDSAVLIVDFQDAFGGSSVAWGYLYSGIATAEDMLNAVDAADTNLSVSIGGFLNDITYNSFSGIGGSPNFWGTFSATNLGNWDFNIGIGDTLQNGELFGCSYTDFAPALRPNAPIPAFEPFRFTAQDVEFWIGTGTDSAVLVVDFIDGSGSSSFAWGYAYSGIATGEDMLMAVDSVDPNFSVAIGGGFLNDITYYGFAGIGGSPNFWGTYSATNLGNWALNIGLNDTLQDGELFGCAYTDFAPALRPGYPNAAANTIGLWEQVASQTLNLYPNPATEVIFIDGENLSTSQQLNVKITDIMGKLVLQSTLDAANDLDVSSLPTGIYTLSLSGKDITAAQRFIKQ